MYNAWERDLYHLAHDALASGQYRFEYNGHFYNARWMSETVISGCYIIVDENDVYVR